MAWDGSTSWEIYEDYFILTTTGFDADTEVSDLYEVSNQVNFIPSHYSIYVTRSAGATDAVSVALHGWGTTSSNFKPLLTVTDSRGAGYCKSSTTDYTSATGNLSEYLFPFIKIFATTVGAGNTLTVTVIGRR